MSEIRDRSKGRYEMHSEKTKDTRDSAKPNESGRVSMGQKMFEMMGTFCAGQGGFPDCSAAMEVMMESMKKQCCTSNKGAESKRKKK